MFDERSSDLLAISFSLTFVFHLLLADPDLDHIAERQP